MKTLRFSLFSFLLHRAFFRITKTSAGYRGIAQPGRIWQNQLCRSLAMWHPSCFFVRSGQSKYGEGEPIITRSIRPATMLQKLPCSFKVPRMFTRGGWKLCTCFFSISLNHASEDVEIIVTFLLSTLDMT